MFILRLLVLIFLVFIVTQWGQISSAGLNDFGKLISLSFFIFAPLLYILPFIESKIRKKKNSNQILALNVLAGWTVIGWIVSYVWALGNNNEKNSDINDDKADSSKVERKTKQCPYCAEDVLEAAIKCKHCGSDLPIKDNKN